MNNTLLDTVAEARAAFYTAKDTALRAAAAVLLPVKLELQIGPHLHVGVVGGHLRFSPMEIEGLSAVRLPSSAGHSAMLIRGVEGAHSERVSVPHSVLSHCLEGAVMWFLRGEEPRLVEAYEPGMEEGCNIIELTPGQEHSFVVVRPCLNYNLFHPELSPL